MNDAVIEVVATGPGLSLQDEGRAGWRRFGVPPAGPLDRYSAAEANRLLANPLGAPVLEVLMQGCRLRVLRDTWLALAGADFCLEVEGWTACKMPAGAVLTFGKSGAGLCAYLAVPGGFAAPVFFGSVSTDRRNGLGSPVENGTRLAAGGARDWPEAVGRRRSLPERRRDFGEVRELGLLPGPQHGNFDAGSLAALTDAEWTVSASSDRTGFRLEGPKLHVYGSIPSEAVLPGSLQIPGDGRPIVTMADGPTVGGYAKPAILGEKDLDWLAQCPPGSKVRFRWRK